MNKELIAAIKKIITKAGAIALDIRNDGLIVEIKKDNSPVTNADKEVSHFIYSNLAKLTPSIPVICEERPITTSIDKYGMFWLVDPIDGTKSFIKNDDSFTVNIALIRDQIPVHGFIYQPAFDKLCYTDENQQFHVEINNLPVTETTKRNTDRLTAVVSSSNLNQQTKKYIKEHGSLEIITAASSIKLCMIAEGTADIYPKFGDTMEWDIAAGHALINATGGKVMTMSGQTMIYGKGGFRNPHFLAVSAEWLSQKF